MRPAKENLQEEESECPSRYNSNGNFANVVERPRCPIDEYTPVEKENAEFDAAISHNCKDEEHVLDLAGG